SSDHVTVLESNGNVGIGTTNPAAKLDIQGTLNVGEDDTGYDVNFYGSNSGSRFFWDEDRMALRVGRDAGGTHWAPDSIGNYSLATGYNTKASGHTSTAMGFATTASGPYSTAMGNYTTANGPYSTAMGNGSTASGDRSTAMGFSTTASGHYSTAMGANTTASRHYSTAMGNYTTASGYYSTAMGRSTTASGDYSTAIGRWVTVDTSDAIVLGRGVSDSDRLVNNISNSLMIGFNDTTATLFVGGADKRVGIGTESPARKLHVNDVMRLEPRTTVPSSPQMGDMYIRSSDGKLMVYDGSVWQACW
ncbi:hypothetical protein ACFL0G_02645, partial [Candidatus Zixiibacteriota bacterium]